MTYVTYMKCIMRAKTNKNKNNKQVNVHNNNHIDKSEKITGRARVKDVLSSVLTLGNSYK